MKIVMTRDSFYRNPRSSGPSPPFLCEARPPKERIAWSQARENEVIEIAEDDDFAKGLSLRSKGPLESTRRTKLTFLTG